MTQRPSPPTNTIHSSTRRQTAILLNQQITYLALSFASAIIIGTLITLLTNVLGGELTTRFVLKTLTVLSISGSIFGYYLTDLKRAEEQQKS